MHVHVAVRVTVAAELLAVRVTIVVAVVVGVVMVVGVSVVMAVAVSINATALGSADVVRVPGAVGGVNWALRGARRRQVSRRRSRGSRSDAISVTGGGRNLDGRSGAGGEGLVRTRNTGKARDTVAGPAAAHGGHAGMDGRRAAEEGVIVNALSQAGSLDDLSAGFGRVLVQRAPRISTCALRAGRGRLLVLLVVLGQGDGAVRVTAVGVTMLVEEEEANNVGRETERTDKHDELGVGDLGRRNAASDRLETDGDTKSDQENTVDKSTEDLCSLPSVRVGTGRRRRRKFDGVERYNQRQNITDGQLRANPIELT